MYPLSQEPYKTLQYHKNKKKCQLTYSPEIITVHTYIFLLLYEYFSTQIRNILYMKYHTFTLKF